MISVACPAPECSRAPFTIVPPSTLPPPSSARFSCTGAARHRPASSSKWKPTSARAIRPATRRQGRPNGIGRCTDRRGHAYVYLNYGMHCLVNVVTETAGSPAAVLIRALAPLDGLSAMRRRRARTLRDVELCRGPGNLTKAMGITLAENSVDLCGRRLFIEDRGLDAMTVGWSTRIGIRVGTDRVWRCYAIDHPAVSGPAPLAFALRADTRPGAQGSSGPTISVRSSARLRAFRAEARGPRRSSQWSPAPAAAFVQPPAPGAP